MYQSPASLSYDWSFDFFFATLPVPSSGSCLGSRCEVQRLR